MTLYVYAVHVHDKMHIHVSLLYICTVRCCLKQRQRNNVFHTWKTHKMPPTCNQRLQRVYLLCFSSKDTVAYTVTCSATVHVASLLPMHARCQRSSHTHTHSLSLSIDALIAPATPLHLHQKQHTSHTEPHFPTHTPTQHHALLPFPKTRNNRDCETSFCSRRERNFSKKNKILGNNNIFFS